MSVPVFVLIVLGVTGLLITAYILQDARDERYARAVEAWARRSGLQFLRPGDSDHKTMFTGFEWAKEFAFFRKNPQGDISNHVRGAIGEVLLETFRWMRPDDGPIFTFIRLTLPPGVPAKTQLSDLRQTALRVNRKFKIEEGTHGVLCRRWGNVKTDELDQIISQLKSLDHRNS